MHIGIFHERFVGRYGADRVLVILGELLQQRGHRVTLIGVRFSPAVLERFPGQTFHVPDFTANRPGERTLQTLRDAEYFVQRRLPPFDACVVGGYPFVPAIPYLRTRSPQVTFVDFGVVPTTGYPRKLTRLIEGLQADRRRWLREATHIVAISDFIAETQSRPDCDDRVPVTTVLLGADHLAGDLGHTERRASPGAPGVGHSGEASSTYRPGVVAKATAERRRTVLLLGRWEPGSYKNSQTAFDVFRSLLEFDAGAVLLVTADPGTFRVDTDLKSNVFCIGLPSDAELLKVMRVVDAGLSVSLWEGFNLPVAEMQALGKQAVAFRLAAHPEVAVVPEQLCADGEEMAAKLFHTFDPGGPPEWAVPAVLDPWREKFTWRRFGDDVCRILGPCA
jgi:hypothetical protein